MNSKETKVHTVEREARAMYDANYSAAITCNITFNQTVKQVKLNPKKSSSAISH